LLQYNVSGTDWQLAVADNGSGKPDGASAQPKTKLGTGVVKVLAKQLDALDKRQYASADQMNCGRP
jgi:two-component sensor histidine kinase